MHINIIFILTRCVVQHLGLLSKSRGVCSVLESYPSMVCVQRFWWRLHSFLLNLMIISVQAVLPDLADLLWGFWSCRQVDVLLYSRLAALLWASRTFYFFSIWKGIQSYQRECFATSRNVPGSIIPAFLFCHYVIKKVYTGCVTLFYDRASLQQPTLFFYRGEDN